jgi:hypothetical protein
VRLRRRLLRLFERWLANGHGRVARVPDLDRGLVGLLGIWVQRRKLRGRKKRARRFGSVRSNSQHRRWRKTMTAFSSTGGSLGLKRPVRAMDKP